MRVLLILVDGMRPDSLTGIQKAQEIFMNSFAFTTTDENKMDLWYNLSAA